MFYLWAALAGLFICAGGLGLAAVAGSLSLFWLPFLILPAALYIKRQPIGLIMGSLAIIWTAISLAWSPYNHPDQAIKLIVLTPLFILVPFAVSQLNHGRRDRFARYTAIIVLICALFFFIEGLFNAPISTAFKLYVEGIDHGPSAHKFADRTLSRGASGFLLIAGPITIWMWVRNTVWRGCSIFLAISMGIAASAFEVEANSLALVAGILAGIASLVWPKRALQCVLCLAALWLISAPMSMKTFIDMMPAGLIENLPISWQMRLTIWEESIFLIAEAPILGHGLDASREISIPASLNGISFDALPLHPHNFGLHIWLETGAIGAALFALTLFSLALSIQFNLPSSHVDTGFSYCATAWLVMIMFGYGLWQEWHHGALALGFMAAKFNLHAQTRRAH